MWEWFIKFLYKIALVFLVLPSLIVLVVKTFYYFSSGGVDIREYLKHIPAFSYEAVIRFYVDTWQWLSALPHRLVN